MRVALVSPYSWAIPGGVNRHIEELSHALESKGHETAIFAPWDPDDLVAKLTHRGRVTVSKPPENFISLGRTISIPMNGAVSNVSVFPKSSAILRNNLQEGFDVVHAHEPLTPVASWDAAANSRLPTVGTFHTYSTSWTGNKIGVALGARRIFNKLQVRIAVSEAARWTGKRFYGGEYRVIPNGVDLSGAVQGPKEAASHLRVLFVGRPDDRKGLPVLLRAFSALHEYIPARLTVLGSAAEEVRPLLLHTDCSDLDVELAGRVSSKELREQLHRADVLCAPSLGGESFGMVLIEAQAAGTPVVCSDIAGYRDVVNDGKDALLVPPGRPADLALALETLWLNPDRREAIAAAARENVKAFAWPRVADQVLTVYEQAREAHARDRAESGPVAFAKRFGFTPAGGQERTPPRKLPSLDPAPQQAGLVALARKVGLAVTALAGVVLAGLALQKIGVDSVISAFVRSSPSWVIAGLVLMALAPLLRAESWHAILLAALPGRRIRRRDVLRGTLIGIVMSATLPARLGEPSRALVVARRIGRARDNLPVVAGTLISQTFLNIFALVVLGAVMVSSVDIFKGSGEVVLWISLAPIVALAAVLVAPYVLRPGQLSRFERLHRLAHGIRESMMRVREGLAIFRKPRLAAIAVPAQLAAWALQWLACYVLFAALGLDGKTGASAAAAVLFAVNVTAALPLTPSNVGVFQAAVIAVLSGAYGVGFGSALAYGIVLQAVEVGTALAMGIPALMGEGLSWRDVRMRALATAPVELPGRRAKRQPVAEEA